MSYKHVPTVTTYNTMNSTKKLSMVEMFFNTLFTNSTVLLNFAVLVIIVCGNGDLYFWAGHPGIIKGLSRQESEN